MDFSKAGIYEGFIKFLKVIRYYIIASIIVAVPAYLANIHPSQSDILAVALVGLVNALWAGIEKWLVTFQSDEVLPPPSAPEN